jgi:hypothetical protein
VRAVVLDSASQSFFAQAKGKRKSGPRPEAEQPKHKTHGRRSKTHHTTKLANKKVPNEEKYLKR